MAYPQTEPVELGAMRVGDLLTFKAVTLNSYRKATRLINGFTLTGRPTVRYSGWSNFIVREDEIISIERPQRG